MNDRHGVWCAELELSGAAGLRAVVPYRDEPTTRILVRLHEEPLGYHTVDSPRDPRAVDAVRTRIVDEFRARIEQHLEAEGVRPAGDGRIAAPTADCPHHLADEPAVSVVVCTRNRADQLAGTVAALRRLAYPSLEFVIVDNAPSDDSTRRVVEDLRAADSRFRYVLEPAPGLSRARNRGLAEATGEILAYTDDDVSVDEHWVRGIVRGFARRADVHCVTGLVCTAGITNTSEAYFDARASSWSTHCAPRLFDQSSGSELGPLYPYSPGIFGTGASFGFRRSALLSLGGFDEALGAGTRTRGGEDLDIFLRVLAGGGAIAYEPTALVWHHHRADESSLRRQMFGYGAGLTALLTKLVVQKATREDVIRRVPLGLAKLGAIRGSTDERYALAGPRPRGMLAREFAGYVAGPFLYARARSSTRGPAGRPSGKHDRSRPLPSGHPVEGGRHVGQPDPVGDQVVEHERAG